MDLSNVVPGEMPRFAIFIYGRNENSAKHGA